MSQLPQALSVGIAFCVDGYFMSNVFNRDAGTEKRVEIMENKDGETKVKDQIKIALYKSPFIIN